MNRLRKPSIWEGDSMGYLCARSKEGEGDHKGERQSLSRVRATIKRGDLAQALRAQAKQDGHPMFSCRMA